METITSSSAIMLLLLLTISASSTLAAAATGDVDEEWIPNFVDLLEMDYQDQCNLRAEADWALLNDKKDAFEEKMDTDKAFGDFAKKQANELKPYAGGNVKDELLKRKLELITRPGDTLLDTDQWNNLMSYSDGAAYRLYNKSIDCKIDPPQSCSYSDFLKMLATSNDHHLLSSAQASWESHFPEEDKFASDILPLVRNASKANDINTVEEYWETLAEYPGGYSKAQELWEEVQPLYLKLHKYLSLKLQQTNGSMKDDGSIPSHWLGSPFGSDWSNKVELLLPEHNVFKEINKNLKQKFVGGRNAFKTASLLLQRLNLNDLKETFWRDSVFDKTCPTRLVDYCGNGIVQVFTCNDISLNLLLDAHDAVMKAKHAENKVRFRSNSFIIREANRYSALDVALSELGSLLALDPHQLKSEGVLSLQGTESESSNYKIALQLLLAMRDLPRLSYYLAADKWRLKLLESKSPINVGTSWSATRRNISKVSQSDKSYLGDVNILSNKPYLGNFLGVLLKYQVLDALTEELFDSEVDIVKHIADGPQKIRDMMAKGFSQEWPDIVKDSLNIRDVRTDAILEYFQPLTDFLNTELKNPEDDEDDDDQAAIYTDEDLPEEPEKNDDYENIADSSEKEKHVISTSETEHSTVKEEKVLEKLFDENNNAIEEETEKHLDNPFLVSKEDSDADSAASSSDTLSSHNETAAEAPVTSKMPYAWIALGVLILIIVILATVIGRKRYKHKKELERERRDGNA